jgi:DNA-binding beta-propeller fold protein YncE
MLALGQAAASAKIVRQSEGSFTGAEAPGGALGEPLGGVAVDQKTGDVYVLETNAFELGKGVIDKFDASGHYAGVQITGAHTSQGSFAMGPSSALAVDSSVGVRQGDLYVSDTEHHVVDRFSETGAFECQIAGAETEAALPSATECDALGSGLPGAVIPTGLAVNVSGDVYIANDAGGVIDEFGSGGEFLGEIADTHLRTEIGSIALDSSGDLYVNNFLGSVVKFDAAGAFVSEIGGGASAEGVAVDPVTGHVLVAGGDEGKRIAEYEPSGELVDLFGEGAAGVFHFGLAVGGSSEAV